MTEDSEPSSVSTQSTVESIDVCVANTSHCRISCKIGNLPLTDVLVDTGSTVSLLDAKLMSKIECTLVSNSPVDVRSVTSSRLDVAAVVSCNVNINDEVFPAHEFLVASSITSLAILGTDFLSKHHATVSFVDDSWQLSFSRESSSIASSPRVKLQSRTVIPPLHAVTLCGTCTDFSIDAEQVCLVEGLPSFVEKHPSLEVGSVLLPCASSDIIVPVVNRSDDFITLYEGTNIAEIEPVTVPPEETQHKECSATSVDVDDNLREKQLRDYVMQQEHLDGTQKDTLLQLLLEFQDVFLFQDDDLGFCNVYPHTINTGNAAPIKQAARRLPYHRRPELQALLQDMLRKGIIRESNSPWASPIVLVRKKDGTKRLCIDYRKLNKVTVQDAYPLPRIDDTLDSLRGCNVFSTMDLASGYWQLAMSEEDRAKTAFATPMGLYEFNVLPMGVCNGPATFQRAMEKILSDLLLTHGNAICRVFFDDLNVAGVSDNDHFAMLRNVFIRLRDAKLKLKLKKCHFLCKQVEFLGHQISAEGVATMPDKITAVQEWPTPSTAAGVRAFLGLAGYYRKFVKNFSKIAAPLHALTEKRAKFMWTKPCDVAFRILKERLTSAPVLAFPDLRPDAPVFILDTDASRCGMGAVLSQQQDGETRVIAYASKLFSSAQRNYSTYDRELLACVEFIEHFRHYLVAKQFLLRTDHEALKSLFSSAEPRGRRARWLERFAEYDFRIVHRAGRHHGNADAMSRLLTDTKEVAATQAAKDQAISSSLLPSWTSEENPTQQIKDLTPELPAAEARDCSPPDIVASTSPPLLFVQPEMESITMQDVRLAQRSDPDIQLVLTWYDEGTGSFVRPPEDQLSGVSKEVRRYCTELDHFTVRDNVLWRQVEQDSNNVFLLVIPESLQDKAIQCIHDIAVGGHLGYDKTTFKCRQRFFWYGMASHIKRYVSICPVCEQSSRKVSHGIAPLGTLICGYRFERIYLDIVGPLPLSSQGHRYILVAIDGFTRWAQAFPLRSMTAEEVASVFVVGWVSLFGVPHSVHTDQGTQFTSTVFREMCRLLGIRKTQTTPYHPETEHVIGPV